MTGVTFGSTHTSTWGLVLTEAGIGLPEPKTTYLDIPAANGSLDLTEALTGSVYYGTRELTFTFATKDSRSGMTWAELLATVTSAVHGQRLNIVLDDDPDWYYTGRCAVDSFATSGHLRQVVIKATCEPYRHNAAGEAAL